MEFSCRTQDPGPDVVPVSDAAAGVDAGQFPGHVLPAPPHWLCSSCRSSDRNARRSAMPVAGPLRTLTGFDRRTMQSMAGRASCRNCSRVIRLTVLRVTARGARRFAATTPSRACGKAFGRTYRTKCAVRNTGRKLKTDENSSVLTIRFARVKAEDGSLPKALPVSPPVSLFM